MVQILPHNWVSDIAPGERLRQRDVVCHVRPETIRLLMSGFPETSGFAMVLRRAGQALVLSGEPLVRRFDSGKHGGT